MAKGEKSMLILSPTGSGKTVLTAFMLQSAARKNMSSWFICHRRELVKQSMETFDKTGVYHGVIAAGFPQNLKPLIQIASVQTLINRHEKMPRPRLIIWDECHHVKAETWARIFRAYPDAFHIGLTATPERMDGKGLNDFFKNLIQGPSVSELINSGYLCDYKAYIPSTVDMSQARTQGGDFVKSDQAAILDKPSITGSAVDEYIKRANGKRNIVFCATIDHSKHVAEQFNARGIPAAHLDGDTDQNTRDQVLDKFKKGEILTLTNVDLFGEGFDLPAIEVVTLLRATQSLPLFLQMVGRGLRTFPGKDKAIILDHVGNMERHGLPDDDREWSLLGRQKSRGGGGAKLASVVVCPMCFAANEPHSTYCVECEHTFEKKTSGRKLEEKDGELSEINKEQLRKKQQARQEQGKAATLPELIALGKQRGYKHAERWARHVFMAKQIKKLNGGASGK